VNVFAPPGPPGDAPEVASYAEVLRAEATRYGAELGEPRHHDDAFAEKVDVLVTEAVPVVSFTFGCPAAAVVERLHGAGSAVWVTVTSAGEAERAAAVGADALVVQGIEAGGHRGGFDDRAPADVGLLALLQLVRARTGLPLVATGGLATGAAIAAVLVAGAGAAQLGSAFLRTPEAGTSAAHRDALEAGQEPTRITRAFTGRRARGIVNRFMTAHEHAAPSAYPEVHHLTAPVRAAARQQGDPDGINLWAGQAYGLSTDEPAGELVRRLAADARAALEAAARRLER
jgi:nitronate monooxygenase